MITDPIELPDLAATERLAQRLAPLLRRGDVVALEGDLGSGKTTFARYLLQARGVKGDIPSPTFTLVQSYELPDFDIYHFDLYRLKSVSELEELGWEEAKQEGLVLAEWPERARGYLPKDYLKLNFKIIGNAHRQCSLIYQGLWTDRLKNMNWKEGHQ